MCMNDFSCFGIVTLEEKKRVGGIFCCSVLSVFSLSLTSFLSDLEFLFSLLVVTVLTHVTDATWVVWCDWFRLIGSHSLYILSCYVCVVARYPLVHWIWFVAQSWGGKQGRFVTGANLVVRHFQEWPEGSGLPMQTTTQRKKAPCFSPPTDVPRERYLSFKVACRFFTNVWCCLSNLWWPALWLQAVDAVVKNSWNVL